MTSIRKKRNNTVQSLGVIIFQCLGLLYRSVPLFTGSMSVPVVQPMKSSDEAKIGPIGLDRIFEIEILGVEI